MITQPAQAITPGHEVMARPTIKGKFLHVGEEKFWAKGVSYGTFSLDPEGNEQFNPETVERDFAAMAANGFNIVRTYTVPPRWLLDIVKRIYEYLYSIS